MTQQEKEEQLIKAKYDELIDAYLASNHRRKVERIEKAQKKLAQQLDSCLEMRMEVMHSIMALGDTAEQEVLRRRYVMGQSYTDIANAMGVVQRRVYQLHKAGVEKVELRN